jgi:UDP-glucuronate 4-epimerase
LRYFTVYGPRQRPDMAFAKITRALLYDEAFVMFGSGQQTRAMTYVLDVVDATVLAMKHGPDGAVYNVAGETAIPLLDIIPTFERIAGKRLRVLIEERAVGDVKDTSADTSRLYAATGWKAQTPLEEGIEAQLSWGAPWAAMTEFAH